MFVDLHNHSSYSDGSMSPEEIIRAAKEANVSLLAITDHDELEGSRELLKLSAKEKMHVISGVEIDAVEGSDNIHVLGYGVDLEDDVFCRRIIENRAKLDEISFIMIGKMQEAGCPVSVEEFLTTNYDMIHGGWKALYYFMDKGITKSLTEGFSLYDKYQCGYDIVDFPSVKEVVNWIHNAGGIAVLAHPGVSLLKKDMTLSKFRTKLKEYVAFGLDGIECYYPKHTEEITGICLDVCREHCLSITSGSDCHGDFQKSQIGELRMRLEFLQLPACLLK